MSVKRAMTLILAEGDMMMLEELSERRDMSKTSIVRQALRLYQLVDAKLAAGGKLYFEDDEKKEKSELMML